MILIVDDKKENLLSLQSLLSIHRYEVHTADSGEEALKKVLRNNYALIILDVQMPGMDGFEVAEMISGYSKTEEIPIIFLSAVNTDKKFIARGYSSGAIDYITKPIDPDIFLLKVSTLYKLYEQKRELNEMQQTLRNEIEYRKKAQHESQEKTQQLVSTLESIPQIAFTTGTDGRIEYANSQWDKYARNGFPESHPDDPSVKALVEKMVTEQEPIKQELRIKKPGTTEYSYFLLRAVPVREHGKVIKWVGTFTDIDEQKQASRKKDEFISVASHELKTPLTSMKGYIQLLQRTIEPGNPTAMYVERTLHQIRKLDTLIADLLDISKIESGKMKLDMKDFDLGKMLENTIDMIHQTYPEYEFQRKGVLKVNVVGDETRLEQVLQNFLSNAVKYSPLNKKVIIHSELLPGQRAKIGIQDFGIGISKDDQQLIFDKFYRTEESTNNFQGLGLGLYISADILQRHNADFGVESEPGKGSTFYFSLPYINNHPDDKHTNA
jgi:signal transduction histidine kinase/DNA-binding response OmpR family regulator